MKTNTNLPDSSGLQNQTAAARKACLLIFLVCGIGLSAWAPMVPLVKLKLNLDEATLGMALLALGVGALMMMPFTGLLINKFGSRKVILAAAVLIAITLPCLLLANSILQLAIALYVFGAVIGAIDVSMNAHAVLVQERFGNHIMSSFHGMFSIGGLVGSIGMGYLIKFGLSPILAAGAIALMLLSIAVSQYRNFFPHAQEQSVDTFRLIIPRGPLLVLGLMCFLVFLAEGALLDWSAVFLQFDRGFDPSLSGIGYAVFSVAMAVMRLTGDKIIQKTGPAKVVAYGAVLASFGYLFAVSVPWTGAALIGFAMVGLGVANVIPVLFTAAGTFPNIPTSIALPAVTTLGYTGQLAGPALIGFVADAFSLPFALGMVGVLLLLVAAGYRHRTT